MKIDILCPVCHKVIAKKEEDGNIQKTYLWCKRCKKEIYFDDNNKK